MPKPIKKKQAAKVINPLSGYMLMATARSAMFSVPVSLYNMPMPVSRKPDEMKLNITYFTAPSSCALLLPSTMSTKEDQSKVPAHLAWESNARKHVAHSVASTTAEGCPAALISVAN